MTALARLAIYSVMMGLTRLSAEQCFGLWRLVAMDAADLTPASSWQGAIFEERVAQRLSELLVG